MGTGRWVTVAVLLIATLDVEGAVLCSRKGKVKLRPETCKGKETLITDLASLAEAAAAQDAAQGPVAALAARLARDVRNKCVGSPNLQFADSPLAPYFDNARCGGGCRQHDGDQTACSTAYAMSKVGATSCFYFAGACLPCGDCGDRKATAACTNACAAAAPPPTCADATRTTFAGGPLLSACERFLTEETCTAAFHVGRGGAATCYWGGDNRCRGCGPSHENQLDCTNTCQTRTCADPTRTVMNRCRNLGDQPTCEQAWHLTSNDGGVASSCWWDGGSCLGCGIRQQAAGLCTNSCRTGS